jgi:glutamate racemase
LETLIKTLDKKQMVEKMAMDKLVEYAERFVFCSPIVELYLKEKLSQIALNEF